MDIAQDPTMDDPRPTSVEPPRLSSSSGGILGDAEAEACASAQAGEAAAEPVRFNSILYVHPHMLDRERREPPSSFHDLHLDQLVDRVTAAWEDYDLRPFFYTPLADLDAIAYRQEVMQELESAVIRRSVESFSQRMRAMRGDLELARTLRYRAERERWYLAAVLEYRDAAAHLSAELAALDLRSRGLLVRGPPLVAEGDGRVEPVQQLTELFQHRQRQSVLHQRVLPALCFHLHAPAGGLKRHMRMRLEYECVRKRSTRSPIDCSRGVEDDESVLRDRPRGAPDFCHALDLLYPACPGRRHASVNWIAACTARMSSLPTGSETGASTEASRSVHTGSLRN